MEMENVSHENGMDQPSVSTTYNANVLNDEQRLTFSKLSTYQLRSHPYLVVHG